MEKGHFYFIKDEYYRRFNDSCLMRNKGNHHARPCFFAFRDNGTGLYWLIPLSSQVEKYKRVYDGKVRRFGKCESIVFGDFLNVKNVFLIQNICPVSERYIENEYVFTDKHIPARVNPALERELILKARRVLVLHRKWGNIIYPDVLKIEKALLDDLGKL